MRFFILSIFILPLFLCAQVRKNRPLPIPAKEASSVLADSVQGWSFSKDGQWIAEEKLIYPRLISQNEDAYESKDNKLGVDNFESLQIYPVVYGKDTLILLIKTYTTGEYKYPVTKKGWKERSDAYYFLTRKKDLKAAVAATDTSVRLNKLQLLDGGLIIDVNKRKVVEQVLKRMQVRENYDRILVLMTRRVAQTQRVQFHLFSLHRVFPDVEGVLTDFKINGKTVYGSKMLFNYMYYETTERIFKGFFAIPKEFELDR